MSHQINVIQFSLLFFFLAKTHYYPKAIITPTFSSAHPSAASALLSCERITVKISCRMRDLAALKNHAKEMKTHLSAEAFCISPLRESLSHVIGWFWFEVPDEGSFKRRAIIRKHNGRLHTFSTSGERLVVVYQLKSCPWVVTSKPEASCTIVSICVSAGVWSAGGEVKKGF